LWGGKKLELWGSEWILISGLSSAQRFARSGMGILADFELGWPSFVATFGLLIFPGSAF
jgi:hypothetical protein